MVDDFTRISCIKGFFNSASSATKKNLFSTAVYFLFCIYLPFANPEIWLECLDYVVVLRLKLSQKSGGVLWSLNGRCTKRKNPLSLLGYKRFVVLLLPLQDLNLRPSD
jgi:hypothetical protein